MVCPSPTRGQPGSELCPEDTISSAPVELRCWPAAGSVTAAHHCPPSSLPARHPPAQTITQALCLPAVRGGERRGRAREGPAASFRARACGQSGCFQDPWACLHTPGPRPKTSPLYDAHRLEDEGALPPFRSVLRGSDDQVRVVDGVRNANLRRNSALLHSPRTRQPQLRAVLCAIGWP